MTCSHCDSRRIADVSGKCSDMSDVTIGDIVHDGYMPEDLGIGGGDYISFRFCLDCGTIQGEFPRPQSRLERKAERQAKRRADKRAKRQEAEEAARAGLTPEKLAFVESFKEFLDEIGFTDPVAVFDRLSLDTDLLTYTIHYLRNHGRGVEADWVLRLIKDLDAYPEIVEGLRVLKAKAKVPRAPVDEDEDDWEDEDEDDDEE